MAEERSSPYRKNRERLAAILPLQSQVNERYGDIASTTLVMMDQGQGCDANTIAKDSHCVGGETQLG